MLRYTLYRLHLAHTVGQCILRRGDSNALFPNVFGRFVDKAYQTLTLDRREYRKQSVDVVETNHRLHEGKRHACDGVQT